MKKLLNNPWVVGLLVASAIVVVAQAALQKKPSYASATVYEDESAYDDLSADYGDPDGGGGFQPSATGSGDVMQALDALVATAEPIDPFGIRRAEIVSGEGSA